MNGLKTVRLFPLADLSHLSSESPEHDCTYVDTRMSTLWKNIENLKFSGIFLHLRKSFSWNPSGN